MKKMMIMAVVAREQANQVLETLVTSGYPVTFVESRGGVLRQAQYILYTCVDEDAVDDVLCIVRENCRAQVEVETDDMSLRPFSPLSAQMRLYVGNAVVFIWNVERIETY